MPNAYDSAFQNRIQFDTDRRAAAQREEANALKLKRQPLLDQQADEDRALELGDKQRARDEEIATAQRQAQLRGLLTLKTARDKGMDPGEAVKALGPGGLRAFGDTFGDMGAFAVQAKEPGFLEAKIAGLTGAGTKPKSVKSEEYVTVGGKDGVQIIYDDGTNEFIAGAKKQFSPSDGPNVAQASGLPGVEYRPGYGYVDADGNKLSADAVRKIAFDYKASQAAGTAAGKAGEDETPWTPVQAIKADTTLKALTLKNENLNTAIDRALDRVAWDSAGLAQAFKDAGGPPADLKALLEAVGAQIGLDELTKLKQSGVTLGQVTEAEHTLLQSMIASLYQAQSPQQLREGLALVKKQSNKAWRITRDEMNAIAQAKGGRPGGAAPDPEAVAPKPKRSAQYYD